jgi:hypothetical protein
MDRYTILRERIRATVVPANLGLVNPWHHPLIRDRWGRDFGDLAEATNRPELLVTRKMIFFLDYWHLKGLVKDQERKDKGIAVVTTPFERILPKLDLEQYMRHNFVPFIKDTPRANGAMSDEAMKFCLPFAVDMIEAQRTQVLAVTNLTVLNLLMCHYRVPKIFTYFRDAVFGGPITLPNTHKTKLIPVYHPGHNGQMACWNEYRRRGLPRPTKMCDLLIQDYRRRLECGTENSCVG